jgi:GNAT superfamily N-acetyltransferase
MADEQMLSAEVAIRMENDLPYEELVTMHGGMTAAMAAESGDLGYDRLVFTVRDCAGALVGGVRAGTFWRWLNIDVFWIAPEHQHRGMGADLLSRTEEEAIRRGCVGAHFDTYSPAAVRFYEHAGYRVVAQIEAPGAVARYSLLKLFEQV